MFTLDSHFVRRLIAETLPSYQLISAASENIGFGYIFYGFARSLRPQSVVVIGSKAGFAPICFAKGVADNEGSGIKRVDCYETEMHSSSLGKVHFIDPSYNVHRGDPNHNYGIGAWDDPDFTRARWNSFGVGEIVTHFKMRSAEYLKSVERFDQIDLLYIDGDHSYEAIMHDLGQFSAIMSPSGLILAHDVDPENPYSEGYRVLCDLQTDLFEFVRIPIMPGLAILRRK